MFAYPNDETGLYRWVLVMMALYLVAAFGIRWRVKGLSADDTTRFLLTHVFDGATMATSMLILWGIMDEAVLKLIGSTKPFLLIAGAAGFVYSLSALRPR